MGCPKKINRVPLEAQYVPDHLGLPKSRSRCVCGRYATHEENKKQLKEIGSEVK
jgi:hypothetical protein